MNPYLPITHASDAKIIESSMRLLELHSNNFFMEKILRQKQTLDVIPIGVVYFDDAKGRARKFPDANSAKLGNVPSFYIYGRERKIDFKQSANFTSCSIL